MLERKRGIGFEESVTPQLAFVVLMGIVSVFLASKPGKRKIGRGEALK
jgi:hypothetical protein